MANFCPNCGTQNEEGGKFCTNCGSALVNEAPAAPVAEPTAAPACEAPTAPACEAPTAPACETPAAPACETPAAPACETPAAPACETPAAPACETPVAPACETPAADTVEAPVKTRSKLPIIIICALVIIGLLVAGYFLFIKGSGNIVGTWVMSAEDMGESSELGLDMDLTLEMEFKSNGELVYSLLGVEISGKYEVSGDKVTMIMSVFGSETTEEYTYKISGNELTLSDGNGNDQVFTRK